MSLEALLIDDDQDAPRFEAALEKLAQGLLRGSSLVAGGIEHRLVEIELYYFGSRHRDPFAHRNPIQRTAARWYFHRQGASYRGGSFKGLDLTIANQAFGGVLLRSMRAENGSLIDGPSRLVEHLLRLTGSASVADLDARIAGRSIFDSTSPLYLRNAIVEPAPRIVRTARVGLSLKRYSEDKLEYLGRRDRYLTELRGVRAGRVQTALALHQSGHDAGEISSLVGTSRSIVNRWLLARELAAELGDFRGRGASGAELARLLGWLDRRSSASSAPAV